MRRPMLLCVVNFRSTCQAGISCIAGQIFPAGFSLIKPIKKTYFLSDTLTWSLPLRPLSLVSHPTTGVNIGTVSMAFIVLPIASITVSISVVITAEALSQIVFPAPFVLGAIRIQECPLPVFPVFLVVASVAGAPRLAWLSLEHVFPEALSVTIVVFTLVHITVRQPGFSFAMPLPSLVSFSIVNIRQTLRVWVQFLVWFVLRFHLDYRGQCLTDSRASYCIRNFIFSLGKSNWPAYRLWSRTHTIKRHKIAVLPRPHGFLCSLVLQFVSLVSNRMNYYQHLKRSLLCLSNYPCCFRLSRSSIA